MSRPKVIVIGAGIGGLAAAAALRRAGVEIEVYERSAQPNPGGSALALPINARVALASIGIDLGLDKRGRVYEDLHFLTRSGRLIRTIPFRRLGDELGAQNVAIHRAELQRALLEQTDGIAITWGARATGFRLDGDGVRVDFDDGRQARGDALIGADGYNSVVRRQLVGVERPREARYVCWLATPEFTYPGLPEGYVAHYWGPGQRFGLIDIGGGRFYWWGTRNMPAAQARDWQGGKADIARAYSGWADEVQAAVAATPENAIISVPARDRPPLRRWGTGPVTLLGDAAHPMLPSLAQGAAQAVEDAVVLARHLARRIDPAAALRGYEAERRGRATRITKRARALSRIEQLEHPIAIALRNAYIRWMPQAVVDRRNRADLTYPDGVVHRDG